MIQLLENYGSVFLYDYRNYGLSSRVENNEEGLYYDIIGAWIYLTDVMKIEPNNIIVVGQSLGCVPTTKLVADLVEQEKDLPRAMILDSPFCSLEMIGYTLMQKYIPMSLISLCLEYEMDNYKNLQIINNKIPICIFHSEKDEIINIEHSEKLCETGCKLIKRLGYHCFNIQFTKENIEYLDNIVKNKM